MLLLLLAVVRPAPAMDRGAADALFDRQAYAVAAEAYRSLLREAPAPEDDAAERLGLADSLFRLGQIERSRQAYEDYLDRHSVGPGQGHALMGLARACARLQDYSGATKAAVAAGAVLPDAGAWKAVLLDAEALYDSGRFADAEAAYIRLGQRWPGKPEPAYVPYARAWCEYRLGSPLKRPAEGQGALPGALSPSAGASVEAGPGAGPMPLDKELAALGTAAKLFGQAVALDPKGPYAPGARYQQGECFYALGRWSDAAKAWRDFQDSYPDDSLAPAARYSLAWCRFEQGQFNDAATVFHEFSVIYADHPLAPWALYLTGVSLARVHNLDLAESAYRLCLRRYPGSAVGDRCQYGLAWLATMRKDYVAAADDWTSFLEQWPDSSLAPSASFLLADSQYQQGRFAAAHSQYLDLLKRYPRHRLSEDALYYAANASLALGEWSQAENEFQSYLTARPDSPFALDARLRLADCQYASGHMQEAQAGYQALRADSPGTSASARAESGLAWVAFSGGDWEKAAADFKAAAAELPGDEAGTAWLRAGDALFNAADHAAAATAYRQAADRRFSRGLRAQAHFGAGWAQYRLKAFAQAYGEWGQARDLAVDDTLQSEAAYWMGWALFRMGRFADAATDFAGVAAKHPNSYLVPNALVQQANSLHNAGQDQQALALYQKVADRWPKLSVAGDALHGLQISYSALGQDDLAVAAARAFLKSHADSDVAPDVQYQVAEHYLNLKDWPQAEKELDLLKSQYPNSKEDLTATYWRGEARYQDLKFNDAIQDWKDLVARAPQNPLAPRALFRVGLAWYRQQEYAQSENAFRQVLDDYGNTLDVAADARFNLGLTYKRMGRDADAVTAYQAVVHDYPDSPLADMARIRIGYIYEDAGDFPHALAAYRDLASRNRGKLGAEAQYLVGDCLIDLKQSGEALMAYDAVTANFPDQGAWAVTALAKGAEILEAQGRYKEAMARYEKIVQSAPDPSWAASARQRIALMRQRLGLPPESASSKAKAKRKGASKSEHQHRAKAKAAAAVPATAQPLSSSAGDVP
ncbi:MAG TPA: tetratricopeptide repeat protein [bacterium]|nr:tetratricopeptide repeat protein [bacterium]